MEKLQRQRALMQEHMHWLESEIAQEAAAVAASAAKVSASERPPPPAPASTILPSTPANATATRPAAELLVPIPEALEANVQGLHNEVRSGCLLYFGIAAVALAAAVGYIYWRY